MIHSINGEDVLEASVVDVEQLLVSSTGKLVLEVRSVGRRLPVLALPGNTFVRRAVIPFLHAAT
jgi:hypothetical protein